MSIKLCHKIKNLEIKKREVDLEFILVQSPIQLVEETNNPSFQRAGELRLTKQGKLGKALDQKPSSCQIQVRAGILERNASKQQ